MSKGWDNTTIKKLKALIGKGLSTSEIGKRLGLSKNAVVGKLNRLGWNSKSGNTPVPSTGGKKLEKSGDKKTATKVTSAKTVTKTLPKNKTASKKVSSIAGSKKATADATKKADKKTIMPKVAKSTKSAPKNLAMHQRIIQHSLEMANLKPNQCRWPIGDPDSENFHFCGKQVYTGKQYCYEHCR